MSEVINNRARRQETLKRLIRDLHAGRAVEEVKKEFTEQLGDATAGEIAEMEQALIAEGLSETEIKLLCDVHVAVFRESLEGQASPETVPGHPIFTFRAENLAVPRVLDGLRRALEEYRQAPGAENLEAALRQLEKLRQYEKHYQRKENLLFPYLERHNFYGPSSVMWAIHDDIRADWKRLEALLNAGPGADPGPTWTETEQVMQRLDQTIRDMVYKEEHILFPAALERLTEEEWGAIRNQESEIGYCYALPGKAWQPAIPPQPGEALRPPAPAPGGGALLPLEVGALTLDQLKWLLGALPLDLTYVDEQDIVQFFTQSRDRIFTRTPAVIGRRVQNCHPPESVYRVQQILDDFRAGRRDVAEFWIQMGGRFIHIRYFALRDAQNNYRGTLEMVQDLTPLRALEGERRLLSES